MDDLSGEFESQSQSLDAFPTSREAALQRLEAWNDTCHHFIAELDQECDAILASIEEGLEHIERLAAESSDVFLSAKENYDSAFEAYNKFLQPEDTPLGAIGSALEGIDIAAAEQRLLQAKKDLDEAYANACEDDETRHMLDSSFQAQQERLLYLSEMATALKMHHKRFNLLLERIQKNSDLPLPVVIENPDTHIHPALDQDAQACLDGIESIVAEMELLIGHLPANDARPGFFERMTRQAFRLNLLQ